MQTNQLRRRVISTDYYPFYGCCCLASHEISSIQKELHELRKSKNIDNPRSKQYREAKDLDDLFEINIATAIVFAICTAEHLINTYATLTKKHAQLPTLIDRLDLEAKWRIVPELVCGRALASSSAGLHDLHQLIRARNSLVHAKPSILNNPTEDQVISLLTRAENLRKERTKLAINAPHSIAKLATELTQIDRRAKKTVRDHGICI